MKPANCQHEPPYPGQATVTWSFRFPDWVSHQKSPRCPIEGPHEMYQCGEFMNEKEYLERLEAIANTEAASSVFARADIDAIRWAVEKLRPRRLNPEAGVKFEINGIPGVNYSGEISYEEVVQLAAEQGQPSVVYFWRGTLEGEKAEVHGTLYRGRSVKLREGMRFEVCHTSNA